MTRKEKSEEKRKLVQNNIFDVIKKKFDETSDVTASLEAGDRYINSLVRMRPQEKEFIISCAEKLAEAVRRYAEETAKEEFNESK